MEKGNCKPEAVGSLGTKLTALMEQKYKEGWD